jgi:hypothetical protein
MGMEDMGGGGGSGWVVRGRMKKRERREAAVEG